MKLTPRTIEVLKNFATIRPTITIEPGSLLKTMSPSFGIRAFANVDDEFPVPCVIHDLPKFINLINMEESDLNWGKKSVKVSQCDGSVLTYNYANWGANGNPNDIKRGDDSHPLVKFVLTERMLQKTKDAMGAMRYSTIAFVGEKGVLGIAAVGFIKNVALPNTYFTPIGDTDKKFRVYVDIDKLKILPQDYEITIVEKKFVRFNSPNLDYYIAANLNSEFA